MKRLVTSFMIGASERGFSDDKVDGITLERAQSYRKTLLSLAHNTALERFYFNVNDDTVAQFGAASSRGSFAKAIEKARACDSFHVVMRLTVEDELGRMRFVEDPPVLTHIDSETQELLHLNLSKYLSSADPAIKQLMSKFVMTDVVRRVVGVGSVGTRCFIALFTSLEHGYLILQIKEACKSVIAEFADPSAQNRCAIKPIDNGSVPSLTKRCFSRFPIPSWGILLPMRGITMSDSSGI